jgi:hypothetical protein
MEKSLKDTLLKALIGALLVLFIAGSVYHTYKVSSLEKEQMRLQNELAKVDTVTIVDSMAVKKLTTLVEEIRIENKRLGKLLSKKNVEIKNYTEIVAQLQDSIKDVHTKDSLKIDYLTQKTFGVRLFDIAKGPFHLTGDFMKDDPWDISFRTIKADIALEIATVENKNGTWETFVNTRDTGVFITNIDTRYQTYKRSFFEKTKIGFCVLANTKSIDGFGILGMGNYGLAAGYGTEGFKIGALYFIK